MILRAMLQRLYASMISGPGLNSRPHNSRQRIDFSELRHLKSLDSSSILSKLLSNPSRTVECPAKVPFFQQPGYPKSEWSDEQQAHSIAFEKQSKVLTKLRDIAEEATNYYNDFGEHALSIGFPLLSLPATEQENFRSHRILAPVVFVPINLIVRRATAAGLSIEIAGAGADFVQPNPMLLAWIRAKLSLI